MKHRLFIPLMTAILCGASCTSSKQVEEKSSIGRNMQDIEIYFDSISPRFMGSIMITKGDSLIFTKNIGYSDVEKKTPITDTTQFKIGSISKSFTAILTLKAIESGKLSMDDKLIKFFPEANIPNADKITIYHLLHHRSGIQDYINEVDRSELEYLHHPQTREYMLNKISKLKSNFEPGEKFSYSNTGYLLLAYIVEKLNSKSYAELVNEQIALPLGLTHTFCSSTGKDVPYSYRYDDSWTKNVKVDYPHLGTGSIVSSTKDLQKYTYALGEKFFGDYVFDQMTDFVEGYGCGVGGGKMPGRLMITHAGHVEDFWSTVIYDDGRVFTFLTNTTGVWHESVIWNIFCALEGREFHIPSLTFVSLDSSKINEYVGEYKSDDYVLKLTNDGKNLICDDSETSSWPYRLEAKNDNFFQCFEQDVDMAFHPTRDSIKYRRGGERRIFVRQK